jgi:phosphate starvation-inducible protein PhoH
MPLPKHTMFYGLDLTEEQTIYGDSIMDNLVTFCQARAGSGKTTVAVGTAKLMNKPLHYIFPTVEEKALGYTTGDETQKESKYLTPLYDALIAIGEDPTKAIVSKKEFRSHAWVHAYSHNYMRGGNIKDAVVIIDEAQNMTKRELKKVLTRLHDSCHVIVTGDIYQCDIGEKLSGFLPYLMHYQGQSFTQVCELTKNFRGVISAHAETIGA